MRLHIPALLDLLIVSDPDRIADLANDARLDRKYGRGPLFNRLITSRMRSALSLRGSPLPPVAPRGPTRPLPEQAALEARLNALATALYNQGEPSVEGLARYVRGQGPASSIGPLAQEAVGRLFRPDYKGDAASWAAAQVLDQAPRSFNLPLLIWWAATGAVARARGLLAQKVGGDPSGVHGTGVAIHNLVTGFSRMRALWANPAIRKRLTPEAATAQCLVAPEQVLRQPTEAGVSLADEYSPGTLILLQLDAAHTRAPSSNLAFMTQNWARCPAHAWAPALLAAVWRAAQGES